MSDLKTIFKAKPAAMDSLNFELLLAGAIKKPKEFLYSHPEYRLSFFEFLKWKFYLRRLGRGWPVAYILGHKEFYGLDFFVNRNVLIPRPETELMVEEAIKKAPDSDLLIDVGTGSGCVAIAIAKNARAKNICAIDISGAALRVAKKNAKKHGVKIKFQKGNLLLPVCARLSNGGTGACHKRHREAQGAMTRACPANLIITANLPYLTNQQVSGEKSIQKEPKKALVADDKNGLSLYEKLLRQAAQLSPRTTLLLEIDPRQNEEIKILVKKYLPEAKCEIKKDLAGRDRLAVITTEQLPPTYYRETK